MFVLIPIGSRVVSEILSRDWNVQASPKLETSDQLTQRLFTRRLSRNRSFHTLRWHAHLLHIHLGPPYRQLNSRDRGWTRVLPSRPDTILAGDLASYYPHDGRREHGKQPHPDLVATLFTDSHWRSSIDRRLGHASPKLAFER